jgi:integrase
MACLTLPDGRRTNRSTKTSDRKLALRLLQEWQAAADKARQGHFVEVQARKVLNDILAHVGQSPMSNETPKSFLDQWLRGKGDGGTALRYAGTVAKFLEYLGDRQSAPLTAISHQDVLGFIQKREEQGVAPKTLVTDLRTLSAAFNLARKLGLITANPVEHALALHPLRVESSQRDVFSSAQVSALVNAAEGDWKTMVLLGFYTGARIGDCANMRWDNINLVNGVVDFVPQKSRRKNKRVVVPLHPNLLAHLEKLASTDRPENSLCPSLAGRPTSGKLGLSAQFSRLMATACIDIQRAAGLGVRRFSTLSFHSLRHSFNSALANAGVPQEARMKLTGHSSAAINGDYTHLELPSLRAAVQKLPDLV